jgi:acyl-CoA thioesterase-1
MRYRLNVSLKKVVNQVATSLVSRLSAIRSLRSLVALLLASLMASAYSAPKTVLVLGDSLSAEYGLTRGTGWVALAEAKLRSENLDATVINASVSGETTSGGRSRLPALLAKYQPTLVIIELGANDGLRGLPVPAAQANLQAMSDAAAKAQARVLLIGMRMPPNYGRAYADKFYAMYGTLAQQIKAPLVPFMLEGVADKPELFQPDRLHPLASAHPIILANIWPTLQKSLKAK